MDNKDNNNRDQGMTGKRMTTTTRIQGPSMKEDDDRDGDRDGDNNMA
jgi:hypothetical protein